MSFGNSLDGAIVSFFNYGTGAALDLAGGDIANGTLINGCRFENSNEQKWRLIKTDDSTTVWPTWVIRNVQSSTHMNLFEGGTENGTEIDGWEGLEADNRDDNQRWYLVTADASGQDPKCTHRYLCDPREWGTGQLYRGISLDRRCSVERP
ncbi:hypothetical protein F5Y13DRAFT_195462 [Hypoxylon sp. FL1857]|nr:hypothetical protein F5Y13DRAFT_195462 [Hypoxylon sp. FL1857]